VPLLIDILDDEAKRSIAWNLSLLMIGVLICWVFPGTLRDFRSHISIRNSLLAVTAGIASANAVAWLQTHVGRLEEFDRSLIKIALIVLVAPIVEEFFCRGIMLNALLRKNNVIVAVLIESICLDLPMNHSGPDSPGNCCSALSFYCFGAPFSYHA